MGIREKIPYRNHARRHLPGGSDPVAFASAPLGYFSYRNTSDQSVTSGGAGIYLAVSTLDIDTTDADYTTSYVATPNPHVLVTANTATDSVWIIGADVNMQVNTVAGTLVQANLLVTSAGGSDFGFTKNTHFWYEATGTETPHAWTMNCVTWAYLTGITAGSGLSIDAQFFQTNSTGNTATAFKATNQNTARGTRIWGIRIQ